MPRALFIFGGAVTLLLFSVLLGGPVMARVQYHRVFQKVYPDLAAKKVNCMLCHPGGGGDNMQKKNHYAIALEKELGEKSVKDEQRIREALLKLEEGECRSGKWGKRLERGLMPCVCREIDSPKSTFELRLDETDEKKSSTALKQQTHGIDDTARRSGKHPAEEEWGRLREGSCVRNWRKEFWDCK